MEPELRALLDRVAVQDLVTRYYRGVDDGDWALLERTFTEDITWRWAGHDRSGEGTDGADGRQAVVDWLRTAGAGAAVRHHTGSHLVEVDGDEARSESYLVTFDARSLEVLAVGVVEGRHVRTADGWRTRSLHIAERMRTGTVAGLLAWQATRGG